MRQASHHNNLRQAAPAAHDGTRQFTNKRLAISLAAFVAWLLITVVGGQIHTGKGQLADAVTRGLGWPFLLAALFLLAVVVWQQWRDVGLRG